MVQNVDAWKTVSLEMTNIAAPLENAPSRHVRSETLDQPFHAYSLIKAFAVRFSRSA